MRIAIDYTAAVNQTAGIGRFVRSLVDAVIHLDARNQYVLMHAAPRPEALFQFPDRPNVSRRGLRLSERALNIVWHRAGIPLPADWMTGPIDLFHSPDFVLPPLRRTPGILTVHDLAFLLFPECAEESLREYLLKAVPRSVRRADFVVADSENTANDVICMLGVPPERVAVVPGGVDPGFSPVKNPTVLAAARRNLGLDDTPFILFVGVIEPRKNLRGLMDAFAILKSRYRLPHRLVIAGGRGWLSDGIFQYAERSPLLHEMLFTGFVPDADLPALYSAADVLVMPSLYEGFGLPLLEAMACGTPVVASNAASLPEVVGDAGPLVNPNDPDALAEALARVVSDSGLHADLRARGLARAAQFTWQTAAAKLLAVYERVGAAHRVPAGA